MIPDRHILCLACFAVFVPQYADRSVGPCEECGSHKTAFRLALPIAPPQTRKEPIHG